MVYEKCFRIFNIKLFYRVLIHHIFFINISLTQCLIGTLYESSYKGKIYFNNDHMQFYDIVYWLSLGLCQEDNKILFIKELE